MNNNMPINKFDSIADILRYRALEEPERVIYTVEDSSAADITYAGLYKRVLATGSLLCGEAERKPYLLLYESPIEFLIGFLACNIIGITAIPLTIPKDHEELGKWEKVASDSGAMGIISEQKHYVQLCERVEESTKLKTLKLIINQNLIQKEPEFIKSNDAIALLQYTSGSTGDPKGVMLSNDNLLESMNRNAQRYRITEKSVIVNWLPFHHVLGSIFGLLQSIYSNCKTVVMSPEQFVREPMNWMRSISKYHGTHTGAPNFAFEHITEELIRTKQKNISLESLEVIYCAGEPVSSSTMQSFIAEAKKIGLKKHTVLPAYGLTETAQFLSAYTVGQTPGWLEVNREALQKGKVEILSSGSLDSDNIEARDNSLIITGVGYIMDNDKIAVETAENCIENRPYAIGEIYFSGLTVTEGYWKKENLRKQSFWQEETGKGIYLKTGDVGFITEAGEIFLTGRSKDLIIISGVNYIPQDIERTVEKLEQRFLKNSAAAFLSETAKDALVIVQEVRGEFINSEADIWAAKVKAKILETYSIAAADIVFVPEKDIPRTQSGKIQRKKTKEEYLKGKWKDRKFYASNDKNNLPEGNGKYQSRNTVKNQIKRIIARQLDVEEAAVDENIPFMEMGIYSMLFLKLRNEIVSAFEINISASALFNYNTVKSMTEYIYSEIQNTDNIAAAEIAGEAEPEFDDCSEEELLEWLEAELEEMQYEI